MTFDDIKVGDQVIIPRGEHGTPATHETLPDGSILVTVGNVTGIVSSMHLVPTKERQLRERAEACNTPVRESK